MSSAFELTGRTVLVTGGTRGIGRAISLRLARAGAWVVANYARNDDVAEALIAYAKAEKLAIEALRGDLTQPKGMTAVLERMARADGIVSLVHCAATGVHRPFEQLTLRHFDWTMALNARSFFELIKGIVPRLVEGSTVIALSSAGAVRAVPAYTAVGSSKAALESMARHLAAELAPRGIRVNLVSPGSIETDAWNAFPDKAERLADARGRSPIGRLVTSEEVAFTVQFLCSDASRGIVGQTLVVDGGRRIVE